MNSNQDILNYINSIDVGKKEIICKNIDIYLKEKKKKALTDEEIKSHVTNQDVIKRHIDGLSYKSKDFKVMKVIGDLINSEQKDGYNMMSGRGANLEIIPDDSPESYYKNKLLAHKLSDPKARISHYAKMYKTTFDTIVEENKLKTHDEKMKSCNGNLTKFDYGWNADKINEVFREKNPSLGIEITNANKSYIEGNKFSYYNKLYSNPLNLFYPFDNFNSLNSNNGSDKVINYNDLFEIKKIIIKELPDFEQKYNDYYKEFGFKPLEQQEFTSISSTVMSMDTYNEENRIIDELIKNFNLDYDFFKTKSFTKKGEPCLIRGIIDDYKTQKADCLKNGKQFDDKEFFKNYGYKNFDEKILKDAYETEEKLIFDGVIYEYKYRLELAEKGIPTKYPDELVNSIKEIVEKYDELEKSYPEQGAMQDIDYRAIINKKVLDFKKNVEINKKLDEIDRSIVNFEEKNKDAIIKYAIKDKADTKRHFEEIKAEEERRKAEAERVKQELDREITDLYNAKVNLCKKKSNYDLAKLNKALNDELNINEIPKELEEMKNSPMKDSDSFKSLMKKNYKDFTKEKAREALCLITINNKRIDDYNKSGKFMQWWRKNSITALKEQNELLKNQFNARNHNLTLSDIDIENLKTTNISYEKGIEAANRKTKHFLDSLYEKHTANVAAEKEVDKTIESTSKIISEAYRSIDGIFKEASNKFGWGVYLNKNEDKKYMLFETNYEAFEKYKNWLGDEIAENGSEEDKVIYDNFNEKLKEYNPILEEAKATKNHIIDAEIKGCQYEEKNYDNKVQVQFKPGDVDQGLNGPNIGKGKVVKKEKEIGVGKVK